MNNNQTIKCNACGASSVTLNKETNLLECQYCGATMQNMQHPAVQPQSKTKLTAIMISLPLIVIALMVVFWVAFQNMRVHTPVDQYASDMVESSTKTIDPLAKPFLSEEFQAHNTPLKEAQSLAENLSITSQVKGQTPSGGLYWIFAVVNNGDVAISRPGAVVSLFDADGKRTAEQSGWSALKVLKPSESTEVLVFLPEPPESIAAIEINTLASAANLFSTADAPLEIKSYSVTEKNGAFELIGDVQNPNANAVKYSRIYAVARNQAGEPIGMGNAFATHKDLSAGESSGFKLRVGAFLQGVPQNWTVWAQGRSVE